MAERQVVVGTLAMASVNVARVGLQLLVLPILARLLDPSSFGLVALAMPFILFPGMISDIGLGSALVRTPDSSRELESTVFWLAMLIATVLTALIILLAWPVGALLSEPRLPPIIVVLAFVLPMCASLTVPNARISRDRRFGLFATGEILASSIAASAGIGCALSGLGAWSLVIQQFVLFAVKVSWLMPRSGFRPTLFCQPSLVWPHLGFSVNAAGSNLLEFAIKNLPSVIIGGFLGVVTLGHYSLASQVVRVPDMVVSGPMYLPVFTTVARNDHHKGKHAPFVLGSLRALITILAPLFCMLALTAHLVVQVLFGPKWADAGAMLMLLAPSGFFLCFYSFIGAVLMGLGRSGHQCSLLLLVCLSIAAGATVGTFYGAGGAALGLSIGAALPFAVYINVIARQLAVRRRLILAEFVAPAIAAAVMTGVLMILLARVSHWNALLQLSTLGVAGLATFLVVLAAISWRRLETDLQLLFARRPSATSNFGQMESNQTGVG